MTEKLEKIEVTASRKGYRVIDGEAYSPRQKLKAAPDSKGYLRFCVVQDGKPETCWVHRLVAFQKFGVAMHEPGIDVRHLDGNHQNNLPGNIELGTRSQNLRDTPAPERKARARRMNETKHRKLRDKIEASLAAGNGIRPTARLVGCAVSTVTNFKKKGTN